MSPTVVIACLFLLTFFGFWLGRGRAQAMAAGRARVLHSRPHYHGAYVALWCGVPALILFLLWQVAEPVILSHLAWSVLPESYARLDAGRASLVLSEIRHLSVAGADAGTHPAEVRLAAARYADLRGLSHMALAVVVAALAVGGLAWARAKVALPFRARPAVEKAAQVTLAVCSALAIFTTVGIVLSLLFEAIRFFERIPFFDFVFGLEWSPQTALRADQVGSSGQFGAIPLFAGTLLVSLISMLVAAPVGLFSAIYISEYAPTQARAVIKPLLEVLAGIPTVVYGFFAAVTLGPWVRTFGLGLGIESSSASALAAGLSMGIMIIPFVSSLSDDVIAAVPQAMRDGAYGLGATKSETIRQVVIPAALPGIVGSLMLAISRAVGETMIVVMAAGLSANLTANPFQAVTTVTVQIVTLLVGDQEFDSPKTLAAFALGLMLFAVTLCLNIIALHVVRKYREQYE